MEGTLHLHQFVLLDARESRRSAWVGADGSAVLRDRFAEGLPGCTDEIASRELRCSECTAVEDLTSPVVGHDDPWRSVKYEVMDAMIAWYSAIEIEDLDAIVAMYAPVYREPDGRTVESVEVAFRSVLRRYLNDALARLDREWSVAPAWQRPVVRLFTREWCEVGSDRAVVDVVSEMWAGGGSELEPSDMFRNKLGGSKRYRMTWTRMPDGWRIAAMDPPFLRMEDTIPFRMRYQGW
jgi:hypothetical protein